MRKKQSEYSYKTYEKVSYNIKRIRKERGITQNQLSEKVDLSHEFIRRIESKKGRKTFSIDTICRIASALDTNIQDLFEDIPIEQNSNNK